MTARPDDVAWPARGLIAAGGGCIAALFLGVMLWGLRAEVADVTPLAGIIATTEPPVAVQHTTGGEITAVLVTAGAQVTKGDPLLQLVDDSLRTEAARIAVALTEARGEAAIAEAEHRGTDRITLPAGMSDRAAAQFATLFAERRALAAQIRAQQLAERDRYIRRQSTISAQTDAVTRQRGHVAAELAAQSVLRDRGLVQTARVTALAAEVARIDAQLAGLAGEAEAARDGAAGIEAALAAQSAARREEAAVKLRTLGAQIDDLELRKAEVARLIAERLLRAPVTGRVHALELPRAGELLAPAQVAMSINPAGAVPIVRFRIPPEHLQQVTTGQSLRLRTATPDDGPAPTVLVRSVTGAPHEDPASGAAFYLAEGALSPHQGPAPALQTGQPVEVLLPAPPLRPLARFFAPLTASFAAPTSSG